MMRLSMLPPNGLRFCGRVCGGAAQSLPIDQTSRRADTLTPGLQQTRVRRH